MKIHFEKYQGTGNDFIMIDGRNIPPLSFSSENIQLLCNRRFGIGADGLIILLSHETLDFEMRYFNADGSRSFCGNGARCALQFANSLGIFENTAHFLAIDGVHYGKKEGNLIALQMMDVSKINRDKEAYVIDTGSPHYVLFVKNLEENNIVEMGRNIRYSDPYKEKGINVNIVQERAKNHLQMLTYERGVEDETYSCGTGATAVAIAYADAQNLSVINIKIDVKGGQLIIKAQVVDGCYKEIKLIGPAEKSFEGFFTQ